jgi:hypothetical protein
MLGTSPGGRFDEAETSRIENGPPLSSKGGMAQRQRV